MSRNNKIKILDFLPSANNLQIIKLGIKNNWIFIE